MNLHINAHKIDEGIFQHGTKDGTTAIYNGWTLEKSNHELTQQSICLQLKEWHPTAPHKQGPPLVESNAIRPLIDPAEELHFIVNNP